MRYKFYLVKLVPLAMMVLGAILFFYPLQLIVQSYVKPLQKSGATIPVYSGWIKINDSVLPIINFHSGTLGGQTVTEIGNILYKISEYILPAGIAVTIIFSIFLFLGLELKKLLENHYVKFIKK